jgi:cytochrome c556
VDSQLIFLQNAMKDAGLTMDDFASLAKGQTPPNFDTSKLPALEKKLESFDTTGLTAASTKIQTEVKSDCNVDLKNLGGN